ncbi:hypothetical protein GQX74_008898 [Glossina fuscipes]|nr:hypothetical protein GQX74_008898 [Glossina fuscipes]
MINNRLYVHMSTSACACVSVATSISFAQYCSYCKYIGTSVIANVSIALCAVSAQNPVLKCSKINESLTVTCLRKKKTAAANIAAVPRNKPVSANAYTLSKDNEPFHYNTASLSKYLCEQLTI